MEADEEAAIATRRARKQAALRQQKPPAKRTRTPALGPGNRKSGRPDSSRAASGRSAIP